MSHVCKYCPFVGNLNMHDCDGSLANLKPEDLEGKIICEPCFNMAFDTEEEYKLHLKSRRHIVCVLNSTDGDEIIPELIDYYCRVCNKQYQDHGTYSRHLLEETHLTLSMKQPIDLHTSTVLFHCLVCKVMLDAEGYNEHLKNKIHLKQALVYDTINTVTRMSHQEIGTNHFKCLNCDVNIYSFVEYTGHVLSEGHLNNITKAGE